MLNYLVKITLIYSLAFAGIFHLVRTTKSISNYRRSATLATVFLMTTFLGVQVVRFSLGWVDIPDGRYMMIAFAGYYLGFWPMVVTVVTMLTVNALVLPYRFVGLFLIKSTLGVLFYWLGKRDYRKSKPLERQHLVVAVFLIVVIPMILNNFIFPNDNYVGLANENLGIIILTTAIIVYTIFRSVNTEIEREISVQNIMALNEEITATEETLRENYNELENYKNRVEYYAFHDAKTGFYNSDYLLYVLQTMNEESFKPYHLISINICDQNDYREKLGQLLFEMLHYQVGTVLQSKIDQYGRQDDLTLFVVSYGKFIILAKDSDRDLLAQIVNDVEIRLQRFEVTEGVLLNINLAVGGLEIESYGLSAETQLEHVEVAAFEALCQTGGLSKVLSILWFYPELLDEKQYKSRLSIELRHNLNLDDFYVVYQPQFDTTKRIIGAEALLRWNHPEFGNISPGVFIHLAENQGVIHKLGVFVQEQAMAFQKRLKCQSPENKLKRIAINVSLIELMDSDFCDDLLRRITLHELPPTAIVLEITESSVYNQLEDVLVNITRLNDAGISIQLDDFGTGYASISHLNLFPLSVIKIDKSFIDFVADEFQPKTQTVISSMFDMAHRLNMPVVAEGVETKAQFDVLIEMGCDLFQGYYLAKPLSEEVYEAMIV